MPGSWKHTKEKELRDFLEQEYPNTIFISRKPTNTEAIVLDQETGKVIARGGANGDILNQLTDLNFRLQKHNTLLDVPATMNLKKRSENVANQVISYLNELIEINQSNKFQFKYDERGFIKEIKCKSLVYKLK